ncbi:hypothetical protein VTO73DRAFT_13902 [Trametes versicolor]
MHNVPYKCPTELVSAISRLRTPWEAAAQPYKSRQAVRTNWRPCTAHNSSKDDTCRASLSRPATISTALPWLACTSWSCPAPQFVLAGGCWQLADFSDSGDTLGVLSNWLGVLDDWLSALGDLLAA